MRDFRSLDDYRYPYSAVNPHLPPLYIGTGLIMCTLAGLIMLISNVEASAATLLVSGIAIIIVGAFFQVRYYAEMDTVEDVSE